MLIIFTHRDSEIAAFDSSNKKHTCVLPISHLPDKENKFFDYKSTQKTKTKQVLHVLTLRKLFKEHDIIEKYIQSSGRPGGAY